MIAATMLLLYSALGCGVFWLIDGQLMKQEVPYGDVPALVPLSTLRFCFFLFCVFFGIPWLLYILPGALRQFWQNRPHP